MENRGVIFIDGGYLDKILDVFGRPKLNYEKFVDFICPKTEVIRTYYYHCLPYQPPNPTEEQKMTFSNKQKFFRTLNRLDSFTVKEGKLERKGEDAQGNPILQQKRVDVLLATDLVMYSTKHLISHAVLIAGDSDFLPAIEIAKAEGINITLVYSDRKECYAHDELLDVVDRRRLFDDHLFLECKL